MMNTEVTTEALTDMEFVRPLDSDRTRRVLERAVEVQARFRAVAGREEPDSDVILTGVILGADDARLFLQPAETYGLGGEWRRETPLQITVELGDSLYFFSAGLDDRQAHEVGTVLRVKRPVEMMTLERRKSARFHPRESASLQIRSSMRKERAILRAMLLNISPEGLACRIKASERQALPVGDVVDVSLDLGLEDGTIDLSARVMNVTRAATPEAAVVGMEFVQDDEYRSARRKLERLIPRNG